MAAELAPENDPDMHLQQLEEAAERLRDNQPKCNSNVTNVLDFCCTALCLEEEIFFRVMNVEKYVSVATSLLRLIFAAPEPFASSQALTLNLRMLALLCQNVPRASLVMGNPKYGLVKLLVQFLDPSKSVCADTERMEELLKVLEGIAPHSHRALVTEGVPAILLSLEPSLQTEKHLRMSCIDAISSIFSMTTPSEWDDMSCSAIIALDTLREYISLFYPADVITMLGGPHHQHGSYGNKKSRRSNTPGITRPEDEQVIISYCALLSAMCDRMLTTESALSSNAHILASLMDCLLVILAGSVAYRGERGDKMRAAALSPMMSIYYTSPAIAARLFLDHRVFNTVSSVILKLFGRSEDTIAKLGNEISFYSSSAISLATSHSPARSSRRLSGTNVISRNGEAAAAEEDLAEDTTMGGGATLTQQLLSENINHIPLVADELGSVPLLEFLLAVIPVAPYGHSHDDYLSLVYPHHSWTWEDDFHNNSEISERMARVVEQYYSQYRAKPTKKTAVRGITLNNCRTLGFNLATQQFVSSLSPYPHAFRRNPIFEGFIHCRQNGLWNRKCRCIRSNRTKPRATLIPSNDVVEPRRSRLLEDVVVGASTSRIDPDELEDSVVSVPMQLHGNDRSGTRAVNIIRDTCVSVSGREMGEQNELAALPFDVTQPLESARSMSHTRRSWLSNMGEGRSSLQFCDVMTEDDEAVATFGDDRENDMFADGELWASMLTFQENNGVSIEAFARERSACEDPYGGFFSCCRGGEGDVAAENRDAPSSPRPNPLFGSPKVPKHLFRDEREILTTSNAPRAAFCRAKIIEALISTVIPAIVAVVTNSITPLVARHCSVLLLRCLSLSVLYCTDGGVSNFSAGGGKLSRNARVRPIVRKIGTVTPSVVHSLCHLFMTNHADDGSNIGEITARYHPFGTYKGDEDFGNAFRRFGMHTDHSCYGLNIIPEMRVAATDTLILLLRLHRLAEHRYGMEDGVGGAVLNEQQRAMLKDTGTRRITETEAHLHAIQHDLCAAKGTMAEDCLYHLTPAAALRVYQATMEKLVQELIACNVEWPTGRTFELNFAFSRGSRASFVLDSSNPLINGSLHSLPDNAASPPLSSRTPPIDGTGTEEPYGAGIKTIEELLREALVAGVERYPESPEAIRPLLALHDHISSTEADLRVLVLTAEDVFKELARTMLMWCSPRSWARANQDLLMGHEDQMEQLVGVTRASLAQRLTTTEKAKLLNLLVELTGVVVNEVGLAPTEMPSRIVATLPCNYWKHKSNVTLSVVTDILANSPLQVFFSAYQNDSSAGRELPLHAKAPKTKVKRKEVTINGRTYHYLPVVVQSSTPVLLPPYTTVRNLRNLMGEFLFHGKQDAAAESASEKSRPALEEQVVYVRFPRGSTTLSNELGSTAISSELSGARRGHSVSLERNSQPNSIPYQSQSRSASILSQQAFTASQGAVSQLASTARSNAGGATMSSKSARNNNNNNNAANNATTSAASLSKNIIFLVDGVVLTNSNMTMLDALCEFADSGESLREFNGGGVGCSAASGEGAAGPCARKLKPRELRNLPFFSHPHRIQVLILKGTSSSSVEKYSTCGCSCGVPSLSPETKAEHLCSPIHSFAIIRQQRREPCDAAMALLSALTTTLRDEQVEIPYYNGDHRRLSSALLYDVVTQLSAFKFPPLMYAVLGESVFNEYSARGHLASYALWNYQNMFSFDLRVTLMRLLVACRGRMPRPVAIYIRDRKDDYAHVFGFNWVNATSNYSIEVGRTKVLRHGAELLRRFAFYSKSVEFHFGGEPGVGLGPTLEFYELLGEALTDPALNLWRTEEYTNEKGEVGRRVAPLLYPSACIFSQSQYHYETLGLLLGRLLRLGRTTPLQFHPLFLRALRGEQLVESPQVTSMNMVLLDPAMEKSLQALEKMSDEDLVACEITFVLPLNEPTPRGVDPEKLELCSKGATVAVNKSNVLKYTKSVRHYYLQHLMQQVLTPLRCGLEGSMGPMYLRLFTAPELALLLNGRPGRIWPDTAAFTKHVVAAHGYTMDADVVQYLLHLVPSFNVAEQRAFLRFVTGSSTIPTGGLAMPLTVVRRNVADLPPRDVLLHASEGTPLATGTGLLGDMVSSNGVSDDTLSRRGVATLYSGSLALGAIMAETDRSLPTVSTCFHYLKLPEYSSVEVLSERLRYAMKEAAGTFQLS